MLHKKITSLLLALAVLVGIFVLPFTASAATSYTGLNNVQTYFTRVIGSLARADYYNTDVLASVTLSQAVYESGWARYILPVGGKNLFGIKAYSTWSGMVFDQNEGVLYASYDEFLIIKGQSYVNSVSAWQDYESWDESVNNHSALFVNNSRYSAVVGEKDYKKVAKALVAAGYCSDNGYAETVVKLIEQYNFTEYDDITPDEDGVCAIVFSKTTVDLPLDGEYKFETVCYPAESLPSSLVWASSDENVATVDEEGNVKAVSQGIALISATLQNGREACAIVYVDCNATVYGNDVQIRVNPDSKSSSLGTFCRGGSLKVTEDKIYTDASGNRYYPVTGINTSGRSVTGYSLADNIYLRSRPVKSVTVIKDNINLKVGETYEVNTYLAPADATDKNLKWSSSDNKVATVENGTVKALKNGNAVISVTAAGGVKKDISVTVSNENKTQKALLTSYSTLVIRAEPNPSSASRGSLSFLAEVTVTGENIGAWYPITGKNSAGKVISGYAHSAYLRFIPENEEYKIIKAGSDMKVYLYPDAQSFSFGTLIADSDMAVIGSETDGWNYVIGTKNSGGVKAVSGYTKYIPASTPNVTENNGWYGRTTTSLRVRSGAGTSYSALGMVPEKTDIVIFGEAENGWYRVKGTDSAGNVLDGYSSADYIIPLYKASVNVTTGSINFRTEPSLDASVIATLEKGRDVVAVGAESDGWYNIEVEINGVKRSGWAYAQYIKIESKLPAAESEKPDEKVPGFGLENNEYTLENAFLYGVKSKTTASDLLSSFKGNVAVLDADGKYLSGDARVGTGCKVAVLSDGKITESASVIIKADVNGDGVITANDYMLVKRAFLGTYDLNGDYLKAAMLSGRDTLNVADYVMIKRHCLGSYTIE